jgi:hypothetical protein
MLRGAQRCGGETTGSFVYGMWAVFHMALVKPAINQRMRKFGWYIRALHVVLGYQGTKGNRNVT